MARVLVTVSPRMYREAIALAVHRGRPGLDVRIAPPEAAGALLEGFRPHLLVHNDDAEIPHAALSGIPRRVEVVYSDGMDARVHGAEGVSEVSDMSMEKLLRVVDEATELAGRGTKRG
jgi:hypothetical protein